MATGIFLSVAAQDTSIVFDRPGVADGPYTVLPKSVQIESGFSYSNTAGINYVPAVLLRAPLSKRTEMRFTYNYIPQSARFIEYNNFYGYYPVCLGSKIVLMKQKGWRPDIAVTNNLIYPFPKRDSQRRRWLEWETVLLFQNDITRNFSFNYNLGYFYANSFLKSSWEYSACFNYNLTRRLTLFAENYGFLHPNNAFEAGWDGGLLYRVGKRSQVDVTYLNNKLSGVGYHYVIIGWSRNFLVGKRNGNQRLR